MNHLWLPCFKSKTADDLQKAFPAQSQEQQTAHDLHKALPADLAGDVAGGEYSCLTVHSK